MVHYTHPSVLYLTMSRWVSFVGMLLLFFVVTFVLTPTAYAQQTFKPGDTLTIDPAITYGKFDNGLTYYIMVNKKPEKRAELRLAVKTGSVMEDDDQLGLAHFCEHMAFNGTKSFPKNEIINLLEKEGVQLGPDVNAHTMPSGENPACKWGFPVTYVMSS